jgi:hypothetical protein
MGFSDRCPSFHPPKLSVGLATIVSYRQNMRQTFLESCPSCRGGLRVKVLLQHRASELARYAQPALGNQPSATKELTAEG